MPIFNEFRINYTLLDRVVENRKIIPVTSIKLAKHTFTFTPIEFKNSPLGFTEWREYVHKELELIRDKNREN